MILSRNTLHPGPWCEYVLRLYVKCVFVGRAGLGTGGCCRMQLDVHHECCPEMLLNSFSLLFSAALCGRRVFRRRRHPGRDGNQGGAGAAAARPAMIMTAGNADSQHGVRQCCWPATRSWCAAVRRAMMPKIAKDRAGRRGSRCVNKYYCCQRPYWSPLLRSQQ